MAERQIKAVFITKILFVSILFLLSGCITPSKAPMPQARRRAMDDVLVFRDLQQIDLDNDGIKDIVAIYAVSSDSSGVKVIKFHNSKGDVIFERVFDTPNVKFAMKDNVPILITEQKVEIAGCMSGRLKSIYRWNGKAFELAGKK